MALDCYSTLHFQHLTIAHKCTLLIYSKNRDIARKIRPEFLNCYYSDDGKECIKLIQRLNTSQDKVGSIDITLIEVSENKNDTNPYKLLEYINKRSLDPKTSTFPLIAAVVLLPQQCGQDILASMDSIGCATSFLRQPCTLNQILFTVCEASYNRYKIEDAYNDLRKMKATFKYQSIPIFNHTIRDRDDEDEDEDEGDSKLNNGSTNKADKHAADDSSYLGVDSFATPDNIEDWTHSSSILPSNMKELRRMNMELDHNNNKNELINHMHLADYKIISNNGTDGNHTVININNLNDGDGGDDDSGSLSIGSKGASYDGLDNAVNTRQRSGGINLVRSKKKTIDKSKINLDRLLSPMERPKWGYGSGLPAILSKDFINKISGNYSSSGGVSSGTDRFNYSSDVFFARASPSLSVEHTIGGLDKKIASQCWQVMNARKQQQKNEHESQHSGNHSCNNSIASTNTSRIGNTIHRHTNKHQQHQQQLHIDEELFPTTGDYKDSIRAFSKAERMIKKLARDAAPDIQIHSLIEVDFNQRSSYCGEKDLYEQGLLYELDGEEMQAVSTYMRAGLHSKEPHLSKIFLGILAYKQNKYMQSLTHFKNAIASLAVAHVYNQYDDFIAYYNRSIVYLRLGDDANGLIDLQHALKLNPTCLKASEVYALALRRVHRYDECISLVTANRKVRMSKAMEEERLLVLKKEKQKEAEEKNDCNSISDGSNGSNGSSSSKVMMGRSNSVDSRSVSPSSCHSTAPSPMPSNRLSGRKRLSLKGVVMQTMQAQSPADVAKDIAAVRGRMVTVDDECNGSLQTRVARATQLNDSHVSDEPDATSAAGDSSALAMFKLEVGINGALFNNICVGPTEIQQGLSCVPNFRKSHHIDAIIVQLRLLPILWQLTQSELSKLAAVAEYRALTSSGLLLEQNKPTDAVCFLLNGSVDVILESKTTSTVIGHVQQYDCIAHIDNLFKNTESSFYKTLKQSCIHNGNADTSTGNNDTNNDGNNDTNNDGNSYYNRDVEEEEAIEFRALQPNLFASYSTKVSCELLLFNYDVYESILRAASKNEFNQRLEAVESCGLFKKWLKYDKVRMARMGILRNYKVGEVVIEQGTSPDYLYVIVKGMCKAYKRPNKTDIYTRILGNLRKKIDSHDSKYSYHHRLRSILTLPPIDAEHTIQHIDHLLSKVGTSSMSHLTSSEVDRYHLELEYKKYEYLLQKALQQEHKDIQEQNSLESTSTIINTEKDKMCEIGILSWPMFFGEACILEPDVGKCRGTIIAETPLVLFCIHRIQMLTFDVDETLLEDIVRKSQKYPNDKELVSKLDQEKGWLKYKEGLLDGIPKTRWIPSNAEQTIQFVV